MNILIVDDNDADARFVEEVISDAGEAGCGVKAAQTLGEGLELLQVWAADAVLLDLNLPDSSGVATLERFLEDASDLAVVVLTGNDDEELALQAVQLGAQDYIVKRDMSGDLLCRTLRHAIERFRL